MRTFRVKIRLGHLVGDHTTEVASILRACADEVERRKLTPDATTELFQLRDSHNTPIGWAKTYED